MNATETTSSLLVSQREARALLGISKDSMRRLLATNTLEPVLLPGMTARRFRRADVLALVEGRAP
jgi:excisionase family DNA binding protein